MMQVLNTATHKAKKEHICSYCNKKIAVGETYENQTNVFDGELYHWKSHLSCIDLTHKLDMFGSDWGEGLSAEDFREYVLQYLRDREISFVSWTEAINKIKQILITN